MSRKPKTDTTTRIIMGETTKRGTKQRPRFLREKKGGRGESGEATPGEKNGKLTLKKRRVTKQSEDQKNVEGNTSIPLRMRTKGRSSRKGQRIT